MICVSLKPYSRACGGVTGGISDLGIFDPNDLDFTQTTTDGVIGAYTAADERHGVEGISVFLVSFQVDEGEWKWTQSVTGCAVKYDHEFIFQLPENSQTLTNFQQALDAAGCCCGIGMFVRLNSGKVFVAGEKIVNGASIPRFNMKQDGSEGGSGKLFNDFNGGNIHFKGSYSRNLYEFTGGWAVVETLAAPGGSTS